MDKSRIDLVLFDLDGTLADTAPDLAQALNTTLIEHNKPVLPIDVIRPTVSLGGNAMVELAFNIDETHPEFAAIREQFLNTYSKCIAQHTRLFPDIDKVLTELENAGLAWGVVTNKSSWLTDPLMQALNLDHRAACIVSGDTVERRKPHPAPMFHACEILNCSPDKAIYIGDAKRDIEAGKAAGMITITALYGYITTEEEPEQWGADVMVKSPLEIIDKIRELSERQR